MSTEIPAGHRIVVHGCSGSGKSTLARTLGARTGLPVIELDAFFHQPNWTPTPADEFRASVLSALDTADATHGGWIVDGNYESKLQGVIRERATVVLWFDLPRHTVMWRMVRRTLRRAVLREELWNGNREHWRNIVHLDPEASIIRWAWTRHHVYRERLRSEAAEHVPGQLWIRLASQRDVDRVLSDFSC